MLVRPAYRQQQPNKPNSSRLCGVYSLTRAPDRKTKGVMIVPCACCLLDTTLLYACCHHRLLPVGGGTQHMPTSHAHYAADITAAHTSPVNQKNKQEPPHCSKATAA
jgi:hypothetical protein